MALTILDLIPPPKEQANDALERSLRTFAQLKAKYDELSDQYDYVEADRTAAYSVIKDLETKAGVPKDAVSEQLKERRDAILDNVGLQHLKNRF